MRTVTWILSAAVAVSIFAGQSKTPEACEGARTDPYSLWFVKSAFRSFSNDQGMWGAQIHQFNNNSPALPQLGDSISIAVLKLYGLDELTRPENTRTYLTLVLFSFSDRNRVLEKSDQEPRITSLVLDYLKGKNLPESHTERVIDYLQRCTKDFSCSFENESMFFSNH